MSNLNVYQDPAAARGIHRRGEWLAMVPRAWRGRVGMVHRQKMPGDEIREWADRCQAESAADKWLREVAGKIGQLRVPVDLGDSELCDLAESCASKAMTLGEVAPGVCIQDATALRARLAAYVERFGIQAPGEKTEDGPAIARMTCPIWWRRGLRKSQARELEAAAIRIGYVSRAAEVYASNATVERRRQQRQRAADYLAGTEAVNQATQERVTLDKLAAASVANPKIRRGELMMRISGFDHIARGPGGLDHAADFWTATTPSRFHAMRQAGPRVEENPKYDGSNPKDAARYLSKCWARFRAAIQRRGMGVYGFRIAEPHHDGTPHWHLLIFSPEWLSAGRRAIPRLRALFRRYFLADSHDEQGAKARRCTFEAIRQGESAAGYVAKYIAKNIEAGGYQVQMDLEGRDAVVPSQRVEAWASTWGIRQFQQIGGPPVGVWRELRRLDDAGEYSDRVAAARAAADCGPLKGYSEDKAAHHWAAYVRIQGGPIAARDSRPLAVAKTRDGERWDAAQAIPVQAPRTRYGETAKGAVYGVYDRIADRAYCSMRARWEIQRGAAAESEIDKAITAAAENAKFYAVLGFGFDVAPKAPRTRGNNCTREGGADEETAAAWMAAGYWWDGSERSTTARQVIPDGEIVVFTSTGVIGWTKRE